MPEVDFFQFFRWTAGTVATIYATVVTVRSLWGWYVWLAGSDRHMTMLRRYVIVQGLRLRFRTFWGDVLICILLCWLFVLLVQAHTIVYDLKHRLTEIRIDERRLAQSR
jgi:hypothetical protein